VIEFEQTYAVEIAVGVVLIFLYGIGLVFLFVVWLMKRSNRLILDKRSVIQKEGVFSQKTSEVRYRDIRNIQVSKPFGDRISGYGRLLVSSAGQADFEIEFKRCKDPETIKSLIEKRRGG
jgi:uncharacterized membrane protein YdbT with pleckstrin-like domain